MTNLSPIGLKTCNTQVSILVNKGSFASVQQAAIGEDKVNFYDEDLTDARASSAAKTMRWVSRDFCVEVRGSFFRARVRF